MFVERGDRSDWALLHDLHYKAESLPIGPRFWKLTLAGETIGVLVTGNPKGLLKERHFVFPKIKPVGGDTKITNTQRYRYINQNFRVISRFVIDTMYRGIGCGYRMMNLVSRMEGTTFMEIQSSMSKFNLFGQKAGFHFVRPLNANKFQIGLKFFRSHFYSNPQDFEAILQELNTKPNEEKQKLIQICKEFYYRNSALEKTGNNRANGVSRVEAMDAKAVIKAIQQITLASPMYGVYKNPDYGRNIPHKLPLNIFDLQTPNAKIDI
jgi:ABC-type ATPase with predicted acetyltransferase domain